LVRTVALEIGRRLAARGQTHAASDIFCLRHDEVSDAILDGQPRVDLVATRKAQRAWVEAHPGPPTYGKEPGPPPPLDALPEEARLANESLLWYAERIFEAQRSSQKLTDDEITGLPASPGQYQGPARIVRGPEEFAKIEAGDVLVCPITSPVWSVLFPSIGALVTDTGGVLSHPAIIAREYGVPAVVATGNATQRVQDGQVIEVDGAAGLVTASG
jgi:rifampicin phosphotransferase